MGVYMAFSVTIVQSIFKTLLEFAFSFYSTFILISYYLNILILVNFCFEDELEFQPQLARGSLMKGVGPSLGNTAPQEGCIVVLTQPGSKGHPEKDVVSLYK